ncbi:transient receptor potential cation channel subfamily M member 1-like isoform X1 [Symsagittifera roscoffensis]|uniref:transient receptor potential cation channel subfamily M member 1-like isoform X1 n=1 Tax=Symsagittifera roscoffensis TaxID=84072 RepID=UPI00307BF128
MSSDKDFVRNNLRLKNGSRQQPKSQSMPYGTVTFPANGNSSDFIRVVSPNTKADVILDHFCKSGLNNVRLDSLELVISVNGTFNESPQKADAQKEFNNLKEALANILIIGNGWVVSPGESSNQLFSLEDVEQKELAVDLKQSFNFVSVAFVEYEKLADKQVLVEPVSSNLRIYSPSSTHHNIMSEKSTSESLHILSSENTHLVIVDSTSAEKGEPKSDLRELRTSFEECLIAERNRTLPPIINIFAGGSDADITNMMQKLERNQTVILISGLGGLCDLAVDALSNTGSRKLNSENPGLCERLAAFQKRENLHLVDLLTKDSHKQVYEVGSKLLSPDKRIKLAVFDSLHGNLRTILDELAGDPEMETYCWKAFRNALIEKKFPIVEGLVSSDFDVSKHLKENLDELYVSTMKVNPALKEFILKGLFRQADSFKPELLDSLLKQMLKKSGCKHSALEVNQQLLLYSVMQLDQRLSDFFWKRCEEPMASALLAKLLLDQMKASSEFREWIYTLKDLTSFFENKACEFLNVFYLEDPEMAMQNLQAKQKSWFDLEPLDLAEKGNCNTFFSQVPVNRLQRETFYGSIMPSCSWVRLILCILLIIPVGTIHLPWVAKYNGKFYQMKGLIAQQMVQDRSKNIRGSRGIGINKKEMRQLKRQVGLMFSSVYASPVVIYILDSIYTLGIVVAQSYMLTVVFQLREEVSMIEWVLLGLMVLRLFKDIVSCLYYEETRLQARIQRFYLSNKWHIISTVNSLLFIFATTLHTAYDNADASEWTQVLYLLSNVLSYDILLRSCLVWDYVGPYIVMMRQIAKDLLIFLVVVLIFTIGYGISLQSILYSNADSKITWGVIFGILLKPILHVFGENFLDNLSQSGDCDTDSEILFENCQLSFLRPVVGLILFLFYATLVNLMLVNLLIAVFSKTYTQINDNVTLYWNLVFYRSAVKYYSRKNSYPGPIFFVKFVVDLFSWFRGKSGGAIRPYSDTRDGNNAEILEEQYKYKAKKMEARIFQKWIKPTILYSPPK